MGAIPSSQVCQAATQDYLRHWQKPGYGYTYRMSTCLEDGVLHIDEQGYRVCGLQLDPGEKFGQSW